MASPAVCVEHWAPHPDSQTHARTCVDAVGSVSSATASMVVHPPSGVHVRPAA